MDSSKTGRRFAFGTAVAVALTLIILPRALATPAPLPTPPDLTSPDVSTVSIPLPTRVPAPPSRIAPVQAPVTVVQTATVTVPAPPVATQTSVSTSTPAKVHPVAIRIPSIQVSSRDVIPVGRNPDNSMAVPPLAAVGELGWYKYAPVPGDTGPAIVVAHVDQKGKLGLFAKLDQIQPGAVVEIDRSDGQTATFQVTSNTTFPKTQFPASVFNNTPDSELNLITCTGTVDKVHHRYLDQDLVNAVLVSLRPTAG
ncbi:MAG TPA: sortase [Mycobacterium sp.]|nr:sortase [Mycobacterium sp.]